MCTWFGLYFYDVNLGGKNIFFWRMMERIAERLPVAIQKYLKWLGGIDIIGAMKDIYMK